MPVEKVIVQPGGVQSVNVFQGGVKIVVREPTVRIVTVGIQGPPGLKGGKGDTGDKGDKGDQGEPGTLVEGTGDAWYIHTQIAASSSWTIVHNLGKFPSVSVIDTGENIVVGDPRYIDENSLVVEFSVPFSGKAYLN